MKIITISEYGQRLKSDEVKLKMQTLKALEGQTVKTQKITFTINKVIFDRKTQTFKAVCLCSKNPHKVKMNASVLLRVLKKTTPQTGGAKCARLSIK